MGYGIWDMVWIYLWMDAGGGEGHCTEGCQAQYSIKNRLQALTWDTYG